MGNYPWVRIPPSPPTIFTPTPIIYFYSDPNYFHPLRQLFLLRPQLFIFTPTPIILVPLPGTQSGHSVVNFAQTHRFARQVWTVERSNPPADT